MVEGEDKNKKDERKGFAGLSSLVSDVDTSPPPPAAKKEPTNTSGDSSSPPPRSAQTAPPQPRQQPTHQEPSQPPSGSSGGKWLLGIIVAIGMLLWLVSISNNTTTSTTPAFESATQTPNLDQKSALKKSAELSSPKFNEYLSEIYDGPRASVNLVSDFDHNFRTRIRKTQSQSVNFAGEYVLSTWGCGTSCLTGAAVSARTGRVIDLPGSVCCWKGSGENVIYRKDSRLLVLAGLINEGGQYGTHFYELTNDRFIYVKTIPFKEEEPSGSSSTLTAIPSSHAYLPPQVQPQEQVRPAEDMPPVDSNFVLSSAQIRYCLAEEIRLDSAKAALNSYNDADVNRFNAMVVDYNSRCGSYRYRQGALESARRDIESRRSLFEAEGRMRFISISSEKFSNSVNTTQAALHKFESPTYETSFDCAKAKSIPENLICHDPVLAKNDLELAVLFKLAKLSAIDKLAFRQYTRNQWNYRERNCKDRECVASWYEYQKYSLNKIAQTGDVSVEID